MGLQVLSWKDYVNADQKNRSIWLRDLQKSDYQTEVSVLSTRIQVPGDHILIRPGQHASVVVTCTQADRGIDFEKLDERRQLLSISFDTLSDWHITLEPVGLKVFNNRVSGDPLVGREVKHEDLPPHLLGKVLGVERQYSVAPDFQDITDRMLDRIDFLKRTLIGDPDQPRLKDIKLLDDILNALIFLRFLEDYEIAKGNTSIELIPLIQNNNLNSLSDLVLKVFQLLSLPSSTNLFDLKKLSALSGNINEAIFNWLPTTYRDYKQGQYEYDLNLIADHAIGQIYDKYISIVSYQTQNGKLSLFPEYETELHWRRGTGLVYTPEYIARFLVNQVLRNFDSHSWNELRVGDLACGSGVFLRNYMMRLHRSRNLTANDLTTILQKFEATDVNSSAVAAAKLSIAMTSYKCTGKMVKGFRPKVTNSLSKEYRNRQRNKKLDIILMNPPFKGHEQQSDTEKKIVADVLGKYKIGRPDYSLAFLKFAFDRLNENSCMGIILPASFVDGKYAQKIRKLLSENGNIQLLAKFEQYTLFFRGETQIVLMVFKKKSDRHTDAATKILYCRRLPDLALRAVEIEKSDTKAEWELYVTDSRKWGADWPLIPEEVETVLENLYRMHPVLSKIFQIRQGIRMGNKQVFIIRNYREFPLNEQKILKPVVDNDNLYDWRTHKDDRRLIYAYENGNPLSNKEMRIHFPKILEHLNKNKSDLKKRARMGGKQIWELQEPRDYKLMFSPKIVSTAFGLGGDYAFDEKGKYAVTNGNLLIPHQVFIDENAWYYYLALLNSQLFFRLLSRRSVKLKGRQYGLDYRFTKHVPIPIYEETDKSTRDSLVKIGIRAHTEGSASLNFEKYAKDVLSAYRIGINEASII